MAGVWGADGLTLAQWTWASVWFTVALSVKMNILLFLPALGIMMLRNIGIVRTALQMGIVVTMQVRCCVAFWWRTAMCSLTHVCVGGAGTDWCRVLGGIPMAIPIESIRTQPRVLLQMDRQLSVFAGGGALPWVRWRVT